MLGKIRLYEHDLPKSVIANVPFSTSVPRERQHKATHLLSFRAAYVSIELSSLYLASSFWYSSSARRWFIICQFAVRRGWKRQSQNPARLTGTACPRTYGTAANTADIPNRCEWCLRACGHPSELILKCNANLLVVSQYNRERLR